ncbi:acetylxylan esterase [Cohnella lupini]|uniref:Acetyl xylan esterase AXE1 n=1 Tax=Cohnella lupini TaxID=1294267 RepID=A0A3D9IBR4_9BACL|nr:acetylxylan esterase [Cohnella lupini]RED59233.1 acetyl xylan esterase AXE1 [Cohnella lupini]
MADWISMILSKPITQVATFNKIAAPKSLEIYPDYDHESLPGLQDKIYLFLLGKQGIS